MNDDTISRRAALDITPKAKANRDYRTNNLDDAYEDGFDDALNTIAKLPITHITLLPNDTQEIQHGHWVYEKGDCFPKCSVCGQHHGTLYEYYYCPVCGTKMDEEG